MRHDHPDAFRLSHMLCLASFAMLAGCGSTTTTTDNTIVTDLSDAPSEDVTSSIAAWRFSSSRDPMSDAVVQTASSTYSVPPYTIYADISCTHGNYIQYVFTAYDQNNQAASFNWHYDDAKPRTSFEYRADGAQSASMTATNRRYSNQIIYEPAPGLYPSDQGLIHGRSATFKLELLNGDAMVTLDQTDPAVQSALRPCFPNMRVSQQTAEPVAPQPLPEPPAADDGARSEQAQPTENSPEATDWNGVGQGDASQAQ